MAQLLLPLAPGEFLKAIRVFKGWSRAELERRAQVSANRIQGIEYGLIVPTFEELTQLWVSLCVQDSRR
jgi:transcriptional regulator with XRE-family HTH domain